MALGATVALNNTIPALVLAGNKVPLKFTASTNLVETAGVKSSITLTWTAVALANEYFDWLLAGETVSFTRFTCKASPDNSGVQFHDNSGSLSLNDWVALLATDLQKNYILSRYYNITVSGASITVEAKETGSEYSQDFTAGPGIDVTANETAKTGVSQVLRSFYHVVVLLYCNGSLVTELQLNVDENGEAETDVSELLRKYISQDFLWPEDSSDFIREKSGAVMSWYFKYGERWGEGSYQALATSSTYRAAGGGLSWMQLGKMNNDGTSWWARLAVNKWFMSWAPLTRVVIPAEPVKLYYLNYSGATTIKMLARLRHLNIITSWINTSWDTLVSSGSTILHIGGSTGAIAHTNEFEVKSGETLVFDINVGELAEMSPDLYLVAGGIARSMGVSLSEGANTVSLVSTYTGRVSLRMELSDDVCNIYNMTCSCTSRTLTMNTQAATDKMMYEIIASPGKLGLTGLADEIPTGYDIWLTNQADAVISEIRQFVLDYTYYEWPRFFVFKNSLGCFEIFRTTGQAQRKQKLEREVMISDTESDYTSLDREEQTVTNLEKQEFSAASGWLNNLGDGEEFRNWCRDFCLSKEIYQLSGNTIKPVRITSQNLDSWTDKDNLFQLIIEYTNAFSDEFFTKELTRNNEDKSWATEFERAL